MITEVSEAFLNPPVKRGRGRPRKNSLPTSATENKVENKVEKKEKKVKFKPTVSEEIYSSTTVQIILPLYTVTNGSFADVTGDSDNAGNKLQSGWVFCRDRFNTQTNLNEILYCHPAHVGKNVAEFVHLFEKKMNHKKFTTFSPTNWNRATYIKTSKFWQKPVRKSLFTALLRAGLKYSGDFEKALYSIDYLRQTKNAVQRFIDGYTWYVGKRPTEGWYNQFYSLKTEHLQNLLTKKPVKIPVLIDFALQKLNFDKNSFMENLKKQPTNEEIIEWLMKIYHLKLDLVKNQIINARKNETEILNTLLTKLSTDKDKLTDEYKKLYCKKKCIN